MPAFALASARIPFVADVLPLVVRFLAGDRATDSTEKVTHAADMVAQAVTEFARIELKRDKAYLTDVQHAREEASKRSDKRGIV